MNNSAICERGGIRITDLHGTSEFLYGEADGIYDLYASEISTPEGEGVVVTVKDPTGYENSNVLLWGRKENLGRPEPCKTLAFSAVMTAILAVATYRAKKTEQKILVGGLSGAPIAAFTLFSAIQCFRSPPPSPPSAPASDGAPTEKMVSDTEAGVPRVPMPFWSLLPLAASAALLYFASFGSMGLRPAGFSLTADDQEIPTI